MNAPVTRRTLLGATAAAVGTMALPALTNAVAAPAANPDAVLFDLIARLPAAEEAGERAEEEANRLMYVALDAYPPQPEALRLRPDDFSGIGDALADSTKSNGERFYGERAAEWLRPHRSFSPTEASALEPGCQTAVRRMLHVFYAPEVDARRHEIVKAFDAWEAEKRAVEDLVGFTAANQAELEAGDAVEEIESRILGHIPVSLAGLVTKAKWASQTGVPDAAAAAWARSLVDDVVAMAERGAVAA